MPTDGLLSCLKESELQVLESILPKLVHKVIIQTANEVVTKNFVSSWLLILLLLPCSQLQEMLVQTIGILSHTFFWLLINAIKDGQKLADGPPTPIDIFENVENPLCCRPAFLWVIL